MKNNTEDTQIIPLIHLLNSETHERNVNGRTFTFQEFFNIWYSLLNIWHYKCAVST